MDTQQVQVTTDYDRFQLIETNRETNRGHIEALKRAFESMGNLTAVQPILVNDRMEIIDGQHRFMACKELGEPIYYTSVAGLTVGDARQMNILHRGWKLDDFARSYAVAGDINYQKYLEIREDYGFSHSIVLEYLVGGDRKGVFARFRNGEFTLEDEKTGRDWLSKLGDAGQFVPFVNDKNFARAFLRAIRTEGYDHKRMLRKLELHQDQLRRFGTAEDYQRMLEDIYNFQMSESNRLRLW